LHARYSPLRRGYRTPGMCEATGRRAGQDLSAGRAAQGNTQRVRVLERQTGQLEVLVPRKGRAGSSPASDAREEIRPWRAGREPGLPVAQDADNPGGRAPPPCRLSSAGQSDLLVREGAPVRIRQAALGVSSTWQSAGFWFRRFGVRSPAAQRSTCPSSSVAEYLHGKERVRSSILRSGS
jgi:hypothetical protein